MLLRCAGSDAQYESNIRRRRLRCPCWNIASLQFTEPRTGLLLHLGLRPQRKKLCVGVCVCGVCVSGMCVLCVRPCHMCVCILCTVCEAPAAEGSATAAARQRTAPMEVNECYHVKGIVSFCVVVLLGYFGFSVCACVCDVAPCCAVCYVRFC